MKEMKVKSSVEESKASFLCNIQNMTCKCVVFSAFLVSLVFLLGAFVGTKLFGADSLQWPSGSKAGSGAGPEAVGNDQVEKYGFMLYDMREKATQLKALLEDYYHVEGATIDKILQGGTGLKYHNDKYQDSIQYLSKNIIKKLIDPKTETSVPTEEDPDGMYTKQHQYVVGVIGSSVAAAHDNCNFDGYERQLERTMKVVWDAAGFKLGNGLEKRFEFVVRNAGEGGSCGDTHANQVPICSLSFICDCFSLTCLL